MQRTRSPGRQPLLRTHDYKIKWRTKEHSPDASSTGARVREPRAVALEGGEADCHLGHDAREDRTEALVQREWRLARGDQCARREKPARLRLCAGVREGGMGNEVTIVGSRAVNAKLEVGCQYRAVKGNEGEKGTHPWCAP